MIPTTNNYPAANANCAAAEKPWPRDTYCHQAAPEPSLGCTRLEASGDTCCLGPPDTSAPSAVSSSSLSSPTDLCLGSRYMTCKHSARPDTVISRQGHGPCKRKAMRIHPRAAVHTERNRGLFHGAAERRGHPLELPATSCLQPGCEQSHSRAPSSSLQSWGTVLMPLSFH